MPFCHLYYHFVWATYNRLPLITPEREVSLYSFIRLKTKELGGSIHAVGGVADHVHVIAEVPASLAIAAYIKQLKGSSSRYLNVTHPMPDAKFKWQHEYGAFSLSKRNLTIAIAYVESQPQHHAAHTTIAILEPAAFFPTHRP
ncbi:MAG TPA: IS200/IS605 family transposase [Chroococcidiopsis sp.]